MIFPKLQEAVFEALGADRAQRKPVSQDLICGGAKFR